MTTDPNNTSGSGENEDLFDFPLVGAYADQDLDQAAEGAPAAEPEAAPVEAPVAEPTPAPAPAPAPAPVVQEASELDEDLFNFETLFQASQPLTSGEEDLDLGAMLEQQEDMLVPDSDAPAPAPAPAHSPAPEAATAAPAAAAQPAPAPAPAPAAAAAPQAASAPRMTVPSDIPETMWAPPMAAPGPDPKRSRLIEVLALCFLVLNTALVLFAWRASDDFRDTLTVVTATVSDAVAEGHNRGQENNAQGTQGSMGVTPDVQKTHVETQDPSNDDPSQIVMLPRATLDLAINRIAEGKFQMARQGLNHLLSNQDRTALTVEMVIEAEALIAESFAAEAKELQK